MTVISTDLSMAKAALLTKYLRGEMPRGAATTRAIPRRPPGECAPLSFAQERQWFLEQWQPGTAIYNVPIPMRLGGALQAEALEGAINRVVARQEVLRTTFVMNEGQLAQIIAPTLAIPLPITDLQGLSATEREAEAQRLMADEARQPFDLAQGPLLRASLLRLAETEHLLLLTIHHVIADGWSLGVLLRELAVCYEANVTGQPATLPAMPIQYADYAVWQRGWLQGDILEEHLAYWRRQLADPPAVLQLPTDRPHPSVPIYRGAVYPVALSRAQTTELKELSRREGVTLFMTVLAAFQVLLGRYSGKDDIVVGAPIAGRIRPETEPLIGLFANTLALRTDLSGDPGFRELLGRVRQVALDAYAHQELPFEQLVVALHPTRDPSRNPLFQVMLALQNPSYPDTLGGLAIERLAVHTDTARFDLTLSLEDTASGLAGTIEYSTDLFETATIARMAEHFRVLLGGILADPECRLSELPLLTEVERQQILFEWNTSETEHYPDRTIPERFEDQVARAPNAIAVVCEGERLTYAQLNARANHLAHHLRQRGAGPEVLVGLCVERSLEMVVGILGILKSGSAYVPLDPTYPKERLGFIVADTQIPILVTQARLVGMLPKYEGNVVYLDRDWPTIAQADDANPASGVQAQNLAYIIYTSGSTGTPKGVMVGHANVTRLFDATQQWFQFDQNDTWTLFHSYAFDFSVWELWGALLYGGRLVVVPFWISRSSRAFYDLLHAEQVTVLNQTPSAFRQLIAVEERPGTARPLTLRLVIFGGEALDPQSLRPWFARHGDQSPQLVNMYGITETTVHVTYYPLTTADVEAGSRNPIGRAIPDLQLYILDQHRQPVPVGVPGELYVGGAGVARGYLKRPDLTAERFIPHPFEARSGARLYKTGDLARYQPDGAIEYLGRLDHQVKIRGFRIELGEIEAALMLHPGVREVLALARDEQPGESRLVAYVVPRQGGSPSANDLRRALAAQLPDYMIPSAFVLINAIPLTANGKVDRRALLALSTTDSQREVSFVPPKGLLQLQLASIWEEILDVRPVGITDDFFGMGGHSLLAARLVDRIAEVCGYALPIATFFAGATIEHLEEALLQRADEQPPSPVIQVQKGNAKRPFFFLHGDLEDGGVYCIKLARALDPALPFCAIHPVGVDGQPVPFTVEQIAANHLVALRAVQPEGPYLLGGFCNGALFAFEMARQLQAQGEHVEALVLIEPGRAHLSVRGAGILIGLWGKLARLDPEKQIRLFLRLRADYIDKSRRFLSHDRMRMIATFDSLMRKRLERLARVLLPGDRHILLPSLLPQDHAGNLRSRISFEMQYRYSWAGSRYVPQRYRGRVALYQASEGQGGSGSDLTLGWKDFIDDIDVFITPGTLFSSITTHVEALAEQIRAWLDTHEHAVSEQDGSGNARA